ncbi:hypothetical protein IWX90DRAFT_268153 [Phyllosticta citrichinensis]|uniref:Cyclase n=1 Tax=Phyllosticta citrichinensis TaxID=1130410 RepID=A0ABR1XMT3_9PEZI
MSDYTSAAARRLSQIGNLLKSNKKAMALPWNPDSTEFPTRNELSKVDGAPEGAAWVWGKDDFIGRLNLLTPSRVLAASKEIRTGEIVPVNLPLNVPEVPAFEREAFQHEIKTIIENTAYDDKYSLNTQSGTQWDGFRHFCHLPTGSFYNNTKSDDIVGPNANSKCSIHHWAEHGIAGRGVLIDYLSYAKKKGIEYDPYDHYEISYEELEACGKDQGLDIRPAAKGGDMQIGDIVFIRTGFVEAYHQKPRDERNALAQRHSDLSTESGQRWAGLKQETAMLDWLHDCYFAAVAGDAPSFEAWPAQYGWYLHEYILALWGMPIGEMLDLEGLVQKCRERKRWTFFFSSAPANCPGGVSTHVNGNAIF